MKYLTLLSVGILLTYVGLNAQIIDVSADKSIQAAIDTATAGDTILVAEGTYLENINFKGKAITVASQFILDGDTSHISKTIIDGSQPLHPDTASTVLMISGEDSTSVLCGFSITGGRGALIKGLPVIPYDTPLKMGGGILIIDGGCMVEYNVIRDNTIGPGYPSYIAGGAGVHVNISRSERSNGKSIVIRHNSIQYNKLFGNMSGGAGMHIYVDNATGDLITNISIQNNSITHNSSVETVANSYSVGVGICMGLKLPVRNGNYEIRNNIISHNRIEHSGTSTAHGAGIYVYYLGNGENSNPSPLIYNNIITNNYAYRGGGLSVYYWELPFASQINIRPLVFNNTFVDNISSIGPGFDATSAKPLLVNNIFWDKLSSPSQSEFLSKDAAINALHNNIQGGWGPPQFNNIDQDPLLEADYGLSPSSPCIGKGIDSIEVDGLWYCAPQYDYRGIERPDPYRGDVDMGAFEFVPPTEIQFPEVINNRVLIYPNPMSDHARIQTKDGSQIRNVSIIDMTGRIIHKKSMINSHEAILGPLHMKPGIYLFRIETDEILTQKVLIR